MPKWTQSGTGVVYKWLYKTVCYLQPWYVQINLIIHKTWQIFSLESFNIHADLVWFLVWLTHLNISKEVSGGQFWFTLSDQVGSYTVSSISCYVLLHCLLLIAIHTIDKETQWFEQLYHFNKALYTYKYCIVLYYCVWYVKL